jgi:hypothetical protein
MFHALSNTPVADADAQLPESSPNLRLSRTIRCTEIGPGRSTESHLRLSAMCLRFQQAHRLRRQPMTETRLQRSGCGQSTKGMPPAALAQLRGGLQQRSDSQSAEPRPNRGPRLRRQSSGAEIITPPQKLCSPSLRNRRFVGGLKAINQRRGHSRTLLCWEAKHIFQEVVYTGVHARESTSPVPAATPNPSLKLTRYGRHCKPGLSYSYYRLSPGLQYLPTRAA